MWLAVFIGVVAIFLNSCNGDTANGATSSTTKDPSSTTTTIGVVSGLNPPSLSVDLRPGTTIDTYRTAVTGTTDADARVTFDGADISVTDTGHFRFNDLWSRPGQNSFEIVATAPDGSTRTALVPYLFEPPEGWVVFVGDSLTRGVTPEIETRFEGLRINARNGRPFREGVTEVVNMVDRPDGPQLLVVNLGANGGATPEGFDEIMEVAALVDRVLVVNLRIDRAWERDTNVVLENGVARYENAVLVDWHAAATGNEDEYLRDDNVHLTPAGNAALADLIEQAAFSED